MGILGRRIGVRMAQCLEEWQSRPEVRRMLEREEAAWELADAARAAAGTGAADEEACAALRRRLPPDHGLVATAMNDLARDRTGYLNDRAYRLLTAAAVPAPVRPIGPDVCERFEAERALGRQSLTDAFETLAALEPRLRDEAARIWESHALEMQAAREGKRTPRERRRRAALTGRHAEGADPRLRTDLASLVTCEYAIVTRGGQCPDADPTPFFEREHHAMVGFGDDSRPRACH
jgi:hypothetical protein